MPSRRFSPLAAFFLFVTICSEALGQSESVPRRESEDPLAVRNWAVDFSPLTQRHVEPSGQPIALAAVPSAASHFITMVPCLVRRPSTIWRNLS